MATMTDPTILLDSVKIESALRYLGKATAIAGSGATRNKHLPHNT
jgi:hypothetical protein